MGKKTYQRVVDLLNEHIPTKVSRNEFCRVTGINRNSVDRYRAGLGRPNDETLQKLADYFKVSVAWLRGEELYAVDGREGNSVLGWVKMDLEVCLKEWDSLGLHKKKDLLLQLKDLLRHISKFVEMEPDNSPRFDIQLLHDAKMLAKKILEKSDSELREMHSQETEKPE